MADVLDVLTLDEAKTAINQAVTTPQHNAQLAQWVTFASRAIDAACGPVVNRNVTEVHDLLTGGTIWLRQPPVVSVTTVTSYSAGTATVHTAETLISSPAYGYWFDSRMGAIINRSAYGTGLWGSSSRVEVVYVAGRHATTSVVAAQFKVAAGAIIRRLWNREAGAWARGADPFGDGAAVGFFKVADPVIDELLWDQRKAPALA